MKSTRRILALLLCLSLALAVSPAALAAEDTSAQPETSVNAPAEESAPAEAPEASGESAPVEESAPEEEQAAESTPEEEKAAESAPEEEQAAESVSAQSEEPEQDEAEPAARAPETEEAEEAGEAEDDAPTALTPQSEDVGELTKDDPLYYTPEVTLMEGKDHGYENYYALSSALGRADGEHPLSVKVKVPGRYYVSSSGGALMMRSNTTLDLNGATLIRSGDMYNLMQNESLDGGRSVPGYTATRNVTVKNGALDGQGNQMPGKNLVNLGHAQGLRFENVRFLHGQGAHLLELNGCKDVTIRGCTFDGYVHNGADSQPEAIQLDISYDGTGKSWNGVYCETGTPGCDNTVCENILVEKCQFKDYPAGVGNHHCLYGGPKNKKITIRNNSFTNSVNWGKVNDYEPPAIWCYGFEDSEISGNTITGIYQCGVRFSGGSLRVRKNKIGTKAKPVSYPPIYVTEANSYVKNQKDKRKAESVTGGCVDGNTIYTTYSKSNNGGITVYGKSKLSSVSKNTIVSKKGNGISIGKNSTVKNVKSNKLTNPAKSGIYLGSGGVVTNLSSNTVTNAQKSGIYITKGTAKNVNGNTVKNGKSHGIEAGSSAKVTTVNANTVTGCKGAGIRITNKKLKITVQKNKLTGNKKPLQISAKGNIQKK